MHVDGLGPLAAGAQRPVGVAVAPRSGSEAVARASFAVAFTAALRALDAGAADAADSLSALAGLGPMAPLSPSVMGVGAVLASGAVPMQSPTGGLVAQGPGVAPTPLLPAGVMTAPAAATAPVAEVSPPAGGYPNLTGDLDGSPELLARLDRLAAARGERWTVTSGLRTDAEQARLWADRATNPYPVAAPGTSVHRTGEAADVTIGRRAIQDVVPAGELRAAGLEPLVGDAVHVQLPGARP
jgi:hypothetical protein